MTVSFARRFMVVGLNRLRQYAPINWCRREKGSLYTLFPEFQDFENKNGGFPGFGFRSCFGHSKFFKKRKIDLQGMS